MLKIAQMSKPAQRKYKWASVVKESSDGLASSESSDERTAQKMLGLANVVKAKSNELAYSKPK